MSGTISFLAASHRVRGRWPTLLALAWIGLSAPSTASAQVPSTPLRSVDRAVIAPSHSLEAPPCVAPCSFELAPGAYRVESRRWRGHRPVDLDLEGSSRVILSVRSRRGWRIFGVLAGATATAFGLGTVGHTVANPCTGWICLDDVAIATGLVTAAIGLAFGIGMLFLRDRVTNVSVEPLRGRAAQERGRTIARRGR